MDTELGTEERHRPVDARPVPVSPCRVRRERRGESVDARDERGIRGGQGLHPRPQLGEEAYGVAAGALPAMRVDVGEEGVAVARPRPAVVVGGPREGPQPLRQPFREARHTLLEVGAPHRRSRCHARSNPSGWVSWARRGPQPGATATLGIRVAA